MKPRKSSLVLRLRNDFLLGLLALSPLVVTVWLLWSVVQGLDTRFHALLPETLRLPGLGLLGALLLVLLTGAAARTVIGGYARKTGEQLILRLPLVRSIYSPLKQISQVFFADQDSGRAFKKVVLVDFPSKGVRALAFWAAEFRPGESVVFVPTAPNPTSGYVVIYKNSEIEETPYSVEDALKMVVSCGAVGLTAGKATS